MPDNFISATETGLSLGTPSPKDIEVTKYSSKFPSEKHSQAYFEERIETLKAKILGKIPSQDDLNNRENVFLPLLSGLENAKKNLDSTNALKTKLLEEQKEHKDDDGYGVLLDPLNQALEEAQSSIQSLQEAAINAGSYMVRYSGLVDDRRSLLHISDELLQCTVLIQGTPKKIADWCAQTPDGTNGKLLDDFFANNDGSSLMATFVREGGPSHGNYGEALSIYDKLQSELQKTTTSNSNNSDDSTEASLALKHRLALAVSLELANPIPIFKKTGTFVDPLERFQYFAKFADTPDDDDDDALDEAFYELSIWELRKVVDANATHEDLTWGRVFLRNYRPDQITSTDQKWRYVWSVRTDVGYRHPDHDFENYRELISAGGECGPRAFFGRFISKAWGVPTWGVRQPGHAAMSRYTKDSGWVVCLGAGWQYSWWDDDRYCGGKARTRHGPDFLEETRARKVASSKDGSNVYYQQVVLMECLAEIQGETVVEDFEVAKFWRSLALAQRKKLAQEFSLEKKQFCAKITNKNTITTYSNKESSSKGIASELGHKKVKHHKRTPIPIKRPQTSSKAMSCHVQQQSRKSCLKRNSSISLVRNPLPTKEVNTLVASMGRATIEQTPQASVIRDLDNASIVIPAASFVDPQKPSKNVMILKSFKRDGDQLHLEHNGAVEYELPTSVVAGMYEVSARVVNVHRNQKPLVVQVENSKSLDSDGFELIHPPQGQELEVPYTSGYWQYTKSIRVDLGGQGGKLKFSRTDPCWGLSIKEFVLKPVEKAKSIM